MLLHCHCYTTHIRHTAQTLLIHTHAFRTTTKAYPHHFSSLFFFFAKLRHSASLHPCPLRRWQPFSAFLTGFAPVQLAGYDSRWVVVCGA
jgi:hypothetical protein